MSNFDESKHNRDTGGKFTNKPHAEADGVSLTPTTAPDLFEINEYGIRIIREGKNGATATDLDALSKSPDESVRRNVSWHPNTSQATLRAMSTGDPDSGIRSCALDRLEIWGDELEPYMQDSSRSVRASVAAHPSVTGDLLTRLADDADEDYVVSTVAKNPYLPPAVQDQLAQDEHAGYYVKSCLAGNPKLVASAAKVLAQHPHAPVRAALAENPAAPLAVVEPWASDENPLVRSAFAANPRASAELLEALSRDPDRWVQESVAGNSNAPAPVLRELADSPELGTRAYVARNPNTPRAVRNRLRKDPQVKFRMDSLID